MVNTRTWDGGGVDDNWSTKENWDAGPDAAPAAGDNIIFDGATSNDPCTVDAVAGVFGTITVYGNYTGTITLAVAIEFGAGDIGNTSASNLTFSGDYTVTMTTLDLDTSDTLSMASSANLTLTGAFTCDGTLTPSAGSVITVGGATTITGQLGAAAIAYTLDIDGTLETSTGTLIAPNASGFFYFAGATWNTPSVFTHSSGTVTFNLAGTSTLGNTSNGFYKAIISTGATLDTSAVSNYDLTILANVRIYGTLTTNNSALIVSSGIDAGTSAGFVVYGPTGIFNGGTGTHTFGSCNLGFGINGSNVTFTTGITTFNFHYSGDYCFSLTSSLTFSAPGTVRFTYAGLQLLYDSVNSTRIFNALTIMKGAGNILKWFNGGHFALTITTTLTITSGIFDTITTTSAISNNLIITGASSITGILTTNTSTITTTGLVTVNTGGTFGGATAYTWNINGGVTNSGGTINCGTGTDTLAASKTFANTSGTTNINGGNFWGASSTTSVVTGGGTWNWATVNTKLLDYQFAIITGAYTITMSGNIQTDAVTVSVGGTLAIVSYTIVSDGAYSNSGLTTFTTGTATLNNTLSISAGTFGSAAAYILDLNGSLLSSAGTLIAPTAAGDFTFSGVVMNLPTTFTHSSGLITFDLSGAQSMTFTGDATIWDLTIAAGSVTTIAKTITLTGAKTGIITSDQTPIGILTINNVIITGELHAKYGGAAWNNNANAVIQIIMQN